VSGGGQANPKRKRGGSFSERTTPSLALRVRQFREPLTAAGCPWTLAAVSH